MLDGGEAYAPSKQPVRLPFRDMVPPPAELASHEQATPPVETIPPVGTEFPPAVETIPPTVETIPPAAETEASDASTAGRCAGGSCAAPRSTQRTVRYGHWETRRGLFGRTWRVWVQH